MIKRALILGVILTALVASPAAQAAFFGPPVDFGTTTAPVTQAVTWNAPSNSVVITAFDLNGSRADGPFSFADSSCEGNLGGPGQCVRQITFDPTVVPPGTYTSTYNITYQDGATTATDSIQLNGVADGSPHFAFDSRSTAGTIADGVAVAPVISRDGRYVAFASNADNLVAGIGPPTQGAFSDEQTQVYLRDRTAGTTIAISVNMSGDGARSASLPLAITPDGRFVLFTSASSDLVEAPLNGMDEVFLRDTQDNTTTLVSTNANGVPANGPSTFGAITDGGNTVCFESEATNLRPHQPSGNHQQVDIFCKNLNTGVVTRDDLGAGGVIPNHGVNGFGSMSMSGSGRYIEFDSVSNNLVAGDTIGTNDVFIRDRILHHTSRVNKTTTGQLLSPAAAYHIDADGNRLTFIYRNHGYVKNLVTHQLTRLDRREVDGASLSPLGRYVAYSIWANGMDQLYRIDLTTMKRTLISVAADGQPGNASSYAASIGGDGSIAFQSQATNLRLLPGVSGPAAVYTWTP